MRLTLPHKFTPREYQLPVLNALDSGIKRAVCVWHRRAGKDKTALNYMIKRMWEQKGVYYYFCPTYTQGKKIIWDGIDKDGMRFIDHFPKSIILKKNEAEMKIVVRNGSLFQIVGTDRYDTIVGTNPIGVVFSEYSLQNPLAWEYIRPILTENQGWAMFLYTPRGHNHGYDMHNMAKLASNWFHEVLTIEETRVITKEEVLKEIDEGMDSDLAQQEYYCSFEGAMVGSYFGKELGEILSTGRILNLPYHQDLKVHTAWDLGVGDATAIWFFQTHLSELRLIDYYEASGEGLNHYLGVLQDKKYIYGQHYAPHDIKVRELSTGKSRLEIARGLGINFHVIPNMPLEEGIDTVRRTLKRCWFDNEKTKQGRDALMQYHKEYDEVRKSFRQKPYHDWSSHAADAFRMLCLGYRDSGLAGASEDDKEVEYYNRNIRQGGSTVSTDPFGGI